MTTAASTTPAVSPDSESATRGTTTLADRVVEKIAAQAAIEVPDCIGLQRKIAGIETGRRAVRATAITDGAITSIKLSIAIVYPAPITSTTKAVRSRVQHRVQTLCSLNVDHVDITVASLPPQPEKGRRVR